MSSHLRGCINLVQNSEKLADAVGVSSKKKKEKKKKEKEKDVETTFLSRGFITFHCSTYPLSFSIFLKHTAKAPMAVSWWMMMDVT